MIALITRQALTGLTVGPIFVAISWLMQTDRVVNRIIEGFVQSGRATDLDREIHRRRLRRIPIIGMAMGVFLFGYTEVFSPGAALEV